MPIHIGQIIKSIVEEKRLTQKEFGDLIHKHPKTVPNIYGRADISSELLTSISVALKVDLFGFLYTEEPLKSLRNDEIKKLQDENQELKKEIAGLKKDLQEKQELVETQKGYLNVLNEQVVEYKTQKKDQSRNL